MLPYFPFAQTPFALAMGVQALAPERLIEIDPAEVLGEIRLKRRLLTEDHTTYCVAPTETGALQWDVVAVILPALAARYPQWFRLRRDGPAWLWENRLLHETMPFTLGDAATLPHMPLEWIGRQVQEDLLVLAPVPEAGFPLVAGVLCFPNMWDLAQKLGQSLLTIHTPVPQFADQVGRSTTLLLERMKVGRPVWRLNWSILPLDRLNLVPRYAPENAAAARAMTLINVGEQCFVRIERQTLTRLPTTGGILFTVHTYQTPLVTLARHSPLLQQLAAYLPTVPPTMLRYKGIDRFYDVLMDYLHQQIAQHARHPQAADSEKPPETALTLNVFVTVG